MYLQVTRLHSNYLVVETIQCNCVRATVTVALAPECKYVGLVYMVKKNAIGCFFGRIYIYIITATSAY